MPSRPETKPPTATSGRVPGDSAIGSLPAHLRLWIVSGLGLWFDLASKSWAFTALAPDETRTLIPGLIDARRSLNSGALFGAFPGWVGVFIIASLLALGFVLYVFAFSGRRQWALHLGLACILAGALGNLHDRARAVADVIDLKPSSSYQADQYIGLIISSSEADPLVVAPFPDKHPRFQREIPRRDISGIATHGVVRDFIKFQPIGGFDFWPWVFNVADALLVVGLIVLLLAFWRDQRHARAAAPDTA